MQPVGWIQLHRKIFDNPLLKNAEWFHAWLSLVAQAAYEDTYRRAGRAVVSLKRGQLTASVRGLAEVWHWPKTNVARFLTRLKQEGMITIEKVEPAIGTLAGTLPTCRESLITICNYSKYNDRPMPGNADAGQLSGQKAGRRGSQRSELSGGFGAQQYNNSTRLRLEREIGKTGLKNTRPHHGLTKDGIVFVHYEKSDWADYAADYQSMWGEEPRPSVYSDGKGRWFKNGGEGQTIPDRPASATRDQLEADIRGRRRRR